MEMRPYWLTIENPPRFSEVVLGVGITAHSEDEAKKLFAKTFGNELRVAEVRVIHSADEIDQNHVRPNMGNFLIRGIWYPRGHEDFP
jgi:hypothetical protein